MKHWMKAFLIASLWFFCPAVFGAIFDVAPQDKSKEYLGIIFGGQIGSVNLGGAANPMLGSMFERFNFIIVTIGTVVVSYVGVISVINTAREGEALGKKFTTWMILRAVFGLLFMIPTPGTGYSLIQVIVAWIVLNGIGAANSVWEVVVNQVSSGVQAVGQIEIDPGNVLDTTLQPLAQSVLRSSICMQTLNAMSSFIGPNGPVKINVNKQAPSGSQQSAILSLGTDKYPNMCGRYTISTPSGSPEVLTIKINALNAMFDTISPAARLFTESSCIAPDCPAPGYLTSAIAAYKGQATGLVTLYAANSGALAAAVNAADASTPTILGTTLGTNATGQWLSSQVGENYNRQLAIEQSPKSAQDRITDMKNLGWIHAGGYYYLLSRSETTAQTRAAVSDIQIIPTADSTFTPMETVIQNGAPVGTAVGWSAGLLNSLSTTPVQQATLLNNALISGSTYIIRGLVAPPALPGFGSAAKSSGNDFIDAVFVNPFNKLQTTIINTFAELLTGQAGGDPLKAIANFGTSLMLTAELLPIATMLLSFLMTLAVAIGSCISSVPFAAPPLLGKLTVLVSAVCAMFWGFGATLGIYMPMVPYVIFLTTAFGWMMAVIEAIVGAPILALAMVHPAEGELGKMVSGLGILANIFLRPTLMIFGFIIAASLLRAGIAMLNFSFVVVLQGAVQSTIFSIIAVLALYTGLVLAIVNNSFALIHKLPDNILRWMGISPESFSEKEMAGEAKGHFEKGQQLGEKTTGQWATAAGKVSQAAANKESKWGQEKYGDKGEVKADPEPGPGPGPGPAPPPP